MYNTMIERLHLIGQIYWPDKSEFADENKNGIFTAYLYQIAKCIWYFGVYFGTAITTDFQQFQDWQ